MTAERRKARHRAFDNGEVQRCSQIGDRQIVTRERFEHLAGEAQLVERARTRDAPVLGSLKIALSRIAGSVSPSRRDQGGRRAFRRGQQEESRTAVDRNDRAAIVEADQAVDRALRQELASKRRAAVIARQAPRQDEPDATHRPGERHRALDEQLVLIRVAVRLRRIYTRVASEPDHGLSVLLRAASRTARPNVRANHLPWRIANHCVEPGIRPPFTPGIEEDLGKFQLPVEETTRVRGASADLQQRICGRSRECSGCAEDRVTQRGK
jgi:hypothetical protein